jgi:hypothetical protein
MLADAGSGTIKLRRRKRPTKRRVHGSLPIATIPLVPHVLSVKLI